MIKQNKKMKGGESKIKKNRIINFFAKEKYKLIFSFIITIISWLTVSYSYHNCVKIVGDIVAVECSGMIGIWVSIFSIVPLISEIISTELIFYLRVSISWAISFMIYYLVIIGVFFIIKRLKNKNELPRPKGRGIK